MQEKDIDIAAAEGSTNGGGGVPGGDALLRFVEAAAGGDPSELATARTSVVGALGLDVMIDAAAVAAAFQMMNRVANATGTPLDDQLIDLTASVREELDLDYLSAAGQPSGGAA